MQKTGMDYLICRIRKFYLKINDLKIIDCKSIFNAAKDVSGERSASDNLFHTLLNNVNEKIKANKLQESFTFAFWKKKRESL